MIRKQLRKVTAAMSGIVFAVGFASPANAAESSPANVLPQGFHIVSAPTGFKAFELTDFAYTKGAAFLATSKTGKVAFSDGSGLVRNIADLPVISNNDLGLVGIEVSRDYATSGRIFVSYNYNGAPYALDDGGTSTARGRVSSFVVNDVDDPSSLTDETIVLDGLEAPFGVHSVGQVLAAPDGTLFVGSGDGSTGDFKTHRALRTQELDRPEGRILHINADGSGVASNAWFDVARPDSWQSRTYAMGLRNPFRFTFRPGTESLFVGDVGWIDTEEVDVVDGGENFGWPCWEGSVRQIGWGPMGGSYQDYPECQALYQGPAAVSPTDPLWQYPHVPQAGSASVTGGVFYTGDAYPAKYQNSYFFGDYTQSKIWTLDADATNSLTRRPEGSTLPEESGAFASNAGLPVAFRTDVQGNVSWADIGSSEVKTLLYSPGNVPPVASIAVTDAVGGAARTSSTVAGALPLELSFDGSASNDGDGEALQYEWNFGDGSASVAGATVDHTYAEEGTFIATLKVTDAGGLVDSRSVRILAGHVAPDISLSTPPTAAKFGVAESGSFSASAQAANGTALDSASISWSSDTIHCSISGLECHTHPGTRATGETFQATMPDHGVNSLQRVTATVTDSEGASTSKSFEMHPRLHKVGVLTDPAGASLAEPFDAVEGSTVSITAPGASDGYSFDAWSTGAATATIEYKVPASDSIVTARYSMLVGREAGRNDAAPVAGHRVVTATGEVLSTDGATPSGSLAGKPLNAPVVDAFTSGSGYVLVGSDGGAFAFDGARFAGSLGGRHLIGPIVSGSSTPGGGYRLFAADGGVFTFGDAQFNGSMGGRSLNSPIVSSVSTPSGNGYWMVAADGGVFAFGDAPFVGSMGGARLNSPIVDITATPSGRGYLLTAADGGVFAFGDATFSGSRANGKLNAPVVAIRMTPSGRGYWLVAADGGTFSFGDAGFVGSAAGLSRNTVVAVVD